MENKRPEGCIFYDNRKKPGLDGDPALCDALREQIAYLYQLHRVIDFIVLDSSDSDIVFCALVDEYRNKIKNELGIACTLFLRSLCGRLKRYRTKLNCMARWENETEAALRLVRKSTRLLMIDDGTQKKPFLYEVADSEKIPIHIIDPARKVYRTKHGKDGFIFLQRAMRSTIPHNLKKRLGVLQKGLNEAFEQIHNWRMTELLEDHKEPDGTVFLRKTFQRIAAALHQEMRVVRQLREYGDKRLNALYWKAKDADHEAIECSNADDWELFENPDREPGPSLKTLALSDEADEIALRFKGAFNKKSAARGGFLIEGKLFLRR